MAKAKEYARQNVVDAEIAKIDSYLDGQIGLQHSKEEYNEILEALADHLKEKIEAA